MANFSSARVVNNTIIHNRGFNLNIGGISPALLANNLIAFGDSTFASVVATATNTAAIKGGAKIRF